MSPSVFSGIPVNRRRWRSGRVVGPTWRWAIGIGIGVGVGGCVVSCLPGVAAPAVDLTRLPPPSTQKVDFDRDIRPLLEKSCIRCHGPERPKSDFRLDRRDLALRGGTTGHDIIPGKSEQSLLIHYSAGLVEEMEMPPLGKGDRLTPDQIGLLRAWIDQGADWGSNTNKSSSSLNFTPGAGFVSVKGNERMFREHQWMPEGANGGIYDFDLSQVVGTDSKVEVKGRALRDQYRLTLSLEKPKVGSVRFGWEQWRKYESDVGGYHPDLVPSQYRLDRDLYLDHGRAWVDFTLRLPDWPVLTVGYEYQYRDGEQALTGWGMGDGGAGGARSIFPAYQSLRESVHILKLDLDHEIAGIRIQDQFRGEFYDLKSGRHGITSYSTTTGVVSQQEIEEASRHFNGANTIRLERQFKDWLFGSGGYLYSRLSGDAAIGLTGTYWDFAGTTSDGRLVSQNIVLERESHVVNLNALLGPWEGFTLTTGAQSEWTRQSGFGRATLNAPFIVDEAEISNANSDKAVVEESVALRYTKIASTVLFGEARMRQESTDVHEDQTGGLGVGYDFLRDSVISGQMRDWRAGFSSSPWQRVTFGGHYRRRDYSDHFNHLRDDAFGFPNAGYSAFIRERQTLTDEVEGRCTLRVTSWLKSTLIYKWSDTDYYTGTDTIAQTPGGGHYSGKQDAHTYTFNTTLTPWRRLHLANTVTYRHTRTTTAQNDVPSIVPYRGDLYSFLSTATYVLTETVDLTGSYTYSRADYSQDNAAFGLPLGLDYELHGVQTGLTWRFRKSFTTRLQYGYYTYDEKNTGGWNNYAAHAVFAMVNIRFP